MNCYRGLHQTNKCKKSSLQKLCIPSNSTNFVGAPFVFIFSSHCWFLCVLWWRSFVWFGLIFMFYFDFLFRFICCICFSCIQFKSLAKLKAKKEMERKGKHFRFVILLYNTKLNQTKQEEKYKRRKDKVSERARVWVVFCVHVWLSVFCVQYKVG